MSHQRQNGRNRTAYFTRVAEAVAAANRAAEEAVAQAAAPLMVGTFADTLGTLGIVEAASTYIPLKIYPDVAVVVMTGCVRSGST